MGEAKRRREEYQKKIDDVTRGITDRAMTEGLLIEAGFFALLKNVYPGQTLPAEQVKFMRQIFFAGAQHLWGSIMTCSLDAGDEPTPADEQKMAQIQAELDRFIRDYEAELPVDGHA